MPSEKSLWPHAAAMHCLPRVLVVVSILVHGAAAPRLVSKAMLTNMKPGAVLVDVAIDQGGCFETSKATTYALNNATLGGLLAITDKGWKQVLAGDEHLLEGLNVAQGRVTYEAVANDLGYDYVAAASTI